MGRGELRLDLRVPALGLDRRRVGVAAGSNLKMFREWFRIDIHSVVVDASDEDIEGVEL